MLNCDSEFWFQRSMYLSMLLLNREFENWFQTSMHLKMLNCEIEYLFQSIYFKMFLNREFLY